jgi:predicted Rossmann-fold nucleotide-binding protein
MKKFQQKPPKAYKDVEFLNSPDARTIRMVAEFLGPQRRFRQNDIKDTIVMFGSARIRPRAETLASLGAVESSLRKKRRPTKEQLRELRDAEIQVEMSRYYEDAVELARMLTTWTRKMTSPRRFVICSGGGKQGSLARRRKVHRAEHQPSVRTILQRLHQQGAQF